MDERARTLALPDLVPAAAPDAVVVRRRPARDRRAPDRDQRVALDELVRQLVEVVRVRRHRQLGVAQLGAAGVPALVRIGSPRAAHVVLRVLLVLVDEDRAAAREALIDVGQLVQAVDRGDQRDPVGECVGGCDRDKQDCARGERDARTRDRGETYGCRQQQGRRQDRQQLRVDVGRRERRRQHEAGEGRQRKEQERRPPRPPCAECAPQCQRDHEEG
jgi:hypothetical protein